MEPEPPTSAESNDQVEVIDLTALSDSSSDSGQDRQHDGDGSEDDDGTGSSSSGFEITLDETSRARLHDAISNVNAERLRVIVHKLANTIPAAEEALIQELITLKRKTRDDDGVVENANADNHTSMVVVSRWETCGNCDQEFDVGDERREEECTFHPGELEVNYDADGWDDWDEHCHGPLDTPENRREYPENFNWTCCDDTGNGEGCVHGKHRAAVARKKRRI